MAKPSRTRDPNTEDLFAHERLFPVETPSDLVNALDFNVRMASAMSRALREAAEHGVDRYEIARKMSAQNRTAPP